MKILIVSSNAFSKHLNNGKTLEAIFSAFKPSELAQLFFRPQKKKHIDFLFCDSFFLMSDVDVLNRVLLKNNHCGRQIIEESIDIIDNQEQKYVSKRSDVALFQLMRDLLWNTMVWKNHHFKSWCKNINPDIVFFVGGGSGFAHNIACYVSDNLDIPLITYFTDDYLLYPVRSTIWGEIQRYRMERFYRKTVERSQLLYCIGEMMSREYSLYFNKHFSPIMNIVDVEPFDNIFPNNSKPIISYFGGLHLSRWKMISRFASIVGNRAFVDVYSHTHITKDIADSFSSSGIRVCGSVTGDALKEAMSRSDIVLHVESDDLVNRSYTRLSVSTKIPEYLISSRPIVAYGPNEVASMKVLSENEIGVVINSIDIVGKEREQLNQLIENPCIREKIARKAYSYAVEMFNKTKVANEFRKNLESIIDKH